MSNPRQWTMSEYNAPSALINPTTTTQIPHADVSTLHGMTFMCDGPSALGFMLKTTSHDEFTLYPGESFTVPERMYFTTAFVHNALTTSSTYRAFVPGN